MRFVIDLDSLEVIESATDRRKVTQVEGKRGDNSPFEVVFVRSGIAEELPAGSVLTFGAKQEGKYDAPAVVLEDGFTLSGAGTSAVYAANPSFNTALLNALFVMDGNADNDPVYVDLMAEFSWQIGTGAPTSTKTFRFRVHNDVIRDDEASPTPAYAPIGDTAPTRFATLTSAPQGVARDWRSVASSADGTKLVAVVVGGQIYTSADSGVTWTARESARNWRSVASSADGTKLVAVVVGGQIYTSTDSGATWTARDSARAWYAVASSADGTKLVAVVFGGQIYTSADSGVTWTARESVRNWYAVASSADGTKLVAVVFGGQIYTSTDSGATWTARESVRDWHSVASSADGTKLVAAAYSDQIYTSANSGVTWTARDSARDWRSVASSADGANLVAVVVGGQIYTSADSGVTWTARESVRDWHSVASSADGTKLVAAAYSEQIYTLAWQASATPPYIRTAGGFLYIQEAGVWKKAALSAL